MAEKYSLTDDGAVRGGRFGRGSGAKRLDCDIFFSEEMLPEEHCCLKIMRASGEQQVAYEVEVWENAEADATLNCLKNGIVCAPPVLSLAPRIPSLLGEVFVHRSEQFGAVALEGAAVQALGDMGCYIAGKEVIEQR